MKGDEQICEDDNNKMLTCVITQQHQINWCNTYTYKYKYETNTNKTKKNNRQNNNNKKNIIEIHILVKQLAKIKIKYCSVTKNEKWCILWIKQKQKLIFNKLKMNHLISIYFLKFFVFLKNKTKNKTKNTKQCARMKKQKKTIRHKPRV